MSVIGDGRLARAYQRALALRGVEAGVHDGEAAVLDGLRAILQALVQTGKVQ